MNHRDLLKRCLALGATFVVLTTSTQPTPARAASPLPAALDDASEFREIQRLYSAGEYEEALKRIPIFQRRNLEAQVLAQSLNIQGLIYVLTKRPQLAVAPFRRAIDESQSESFSQFVRYNLATALYEVGDPAGANKVLDEVRPELLDRDNRIKLSTLRARTHLKLEDFAGAVTDYLDLALIQERPEARQALVAPLEQALERCREFRDLERIYQGRESAPYADLLLFRMGALAQSAGQFGSAETSLRNLVSRFPQSPRFAEAQDLLRTLQSQSVVEPRRIGVLVPLSGKFEAFGQKALQAVSLAFRIFNLEDADSKVTLVVEDSGEDVESALAALERLYSKHHVIAVVGPLLSKGIEQVTQKAQDLGLPLVSLAQQAGTPQDNVFQAGFTPRLQAREIARFAIENRGLKRFAIIHPRDRFGEQFTDAFWEAVESMGGQIVGIESYPPGETDFRQAVDKLSGLYYTEARAGELEALAQQRRELKITKKTRKTEQYFNLKPIVDYDAVFIPDEPKIVGQILPTFAYRDVTGVQFLGINTWNSPDLFSRAQNWAVGSLFTEAFNIDSTASQVKRFVSRYRKTYEAEPGAIEALAFDGAGVLDLALSSGAQARREVREFLKSLSNYPGVTGRITYKDGAFQRNVSILTISKQGQILPASTEKPEKR